MLKDKCFLIIDYNLSRIKDVETISLYVKSKYKLKTILIKKSAPPKCNLICDQVIDLDPLQFDFVDKSIKLLKDFHIHSGLVFSDNAVCAGSQLLEKLNIQVDESDKAKYACDKFLFRGVENKFKDLLSNVLWTPQYELVRSPEELIEFFKGTKNFVIKPTQEGNNRGVIFISNNTDINAVTVSVSEYFEQGLICEEIIPFDREFSYDGIGSLGFITQKITLNGQFPVEIGQILPPRINESEANLIRHIGTFANCIVGQLNGPFHNEIKIDNKKLIAANVEPNRRPAGMQIWKLFEEIYGVNLYELWVDSICDKNFTFPPLTREKNRYAFSIMLPTNESLKITRNLNIDLKLIIDKTLLNVAKLLKIEQKGYLNLVSIENLYSNKEVINYPPIDNSDFLANVVISFVNIKEYNTTDVFNLIVSQWKENLKLSLL